jgi:hypothetical protein
MGGRRDGEDGWNMAVHMVLWDLVSGPMFEGIYLSRSL